MREFSILIFYILLLNVYSLAQSAITSDPVQLSSSDTLSDNDIKSSDSAAEKPDTVLIENAYFPDKPSLPIDTVQTSKTTKSISLLNPGSENLNTNKRVIYQPQAVSGLLQNNRKVVISLNFFYFNYAEKITEEEVLKQFEDQFGRPPDTIGGKPKSTEYGPTIGISLAYMSRSDLTGFFLMPECELNIGLNHTYSGSSQAQPIINDYGDTIGLNFEPLDSTKSNFFLNTALCIGYSNYSLRIPFALYSGFRFNLWKRDLFSNISISSYEKYIWLTIPVGFVLYKCKPSWTFSIEGVLNFMFYGQMKMVLKSLYYSLPEFPAVILGNKCGYSLELTAAKKISKTLQIRVSPFMTVYGFGKSNIEKINNVNSYDYEESEAPQFYEPESSTFKVGLNLYFDMLISKVKSRE